MQTRSRRQDGRPACRCAGRAAGCNVCALAHLHAHGIIHHVKPGNIFLVERPTDGLLDAKLGDFGISRLLDETLMAKTAVGTPYYMSPELVAGKGYDGRADARSLGVIAYELCVLKLFHAPNVGRSRWPSTRVPRRYPDGTADLAAL